MLDQEELHEIQKKLKKHITEKRFLHTRGVQYTAVMLAMRYEADLQKAALAGLLHDCAKCLDDDKMKKECKKYDIACSETEKKLPYLLHAKLGACYAKEKYGIKDKEILSAIRYHTTGRADMTLLEKIIFTADYIEPHRKMLEQLPAIRKMAFIDLDQAVYMILDSTLNYLKEGKEKKEKKKDIDEHTLQAYEYYKKKIEEQ